MFEISIGRCLRTLDVPGDVVNNLAITPDRQYLATYLSQQRRWMVWEVASGREKKKIAAGGPPSVFSTTFRINQSAVLREHLAITIWDWMSGAVKRFKVTTPGDANSKISSMVLSPNQRFALIGTYKYGLQVWDLDKGAHISTFLGHTHLLKNVAISPEGQFAYLVGGDELLKKWELDWELEYREPADWNEGAKQPLIN
jgi:WD40 repeat protein